MDAREVISLLETAPTEAVCREAHVQIFGSSFIGVIRTGVGEGMGLIRKARPAASVDYHFYPKGWTDSRIQPPFPCPSDRHTFGLRESGVCWYGAAPNPFAAALAVLLRAAL